MIPLKSVLCGSLLLALAACSSPSTPNTSATASKPAAASTAVPASNPFSPLLKDRDKARAVQQVIDQRAKADRKALKQAQQ